MGSEIVVPETPNWLNALEEKREKRLKARLGHEAGAGAPCLKCGDKCPGLDLHFWRKACKICRCPKEEHDVHDEDIYGWAQFQLLGSKPNKIKTKIVLPGKKDEVELEWTPKGNKDTIDKYLKTLPPESLPVKGSQAAQNRKQLLQKQIPIHDIDPTLCHELNEEELKKMNDYIAHVKQSSVGVGQIVNLSSIIKGTLHVIGPHEAAIIASRYAKGIPLSEIVKLQGYNNSTQLKPHSLNQDLERLDLREPDQKHLPNFVSNSTNKTDECNQNPIVSSKVKDINYIGSGTESKVPYANVQYASGFKPGQYTQPINKSSQRPEYNMDDKLFQASNFDPKNTPSQFLPSQLPYSNSSGLKSGQQSYLPTDDQCASLNLPYTKVSDGARPVGAYAQDFQKPRAGSYSQNMPEGKQNFDRSQKVDQYGYENPLFKNKFSHIDDKTNVPYSQNQGSELGPSNRLLENKIGTRYGYSDSKVPYEQNSGTLQNTEPGETRYGHNDGHKIPYGQNSGSLQNFEPETTRYGHNDGHDILYGPNSGSLQNFEPEETRYGHNDGHKLPYGQNSGSLQNIEPETNENLHAFQSKRQGLLPNYAPNKYNVYTENQDPKLPKNLKDLAFSTYNPTNINENIGNQFNPQNLANTSGARKPLSQLRPGQINVTEDYLEPSQVNIGAIQDISYPEIRAATHGTNDFFEDYSPESIREILNNIKLPDCHYCKKPFEENEFAVTIDRANAFFHARCFKCAGCNQNLADNVYFYHKETDNIYCGRDYAKIRGIPRCKACDELIFTKEYCLAENSTFHLKHFCCIECDTPLAGQDYTLEDEMPYCLPCFEKSKASKCSSCERVIKPDEMGCTLNGVHFHAVDECFACKICKKPLMGKKLLLRNGKLYCSHECYNCDK